MSSFNEQDNKRPKNESERESEVPYRMPCMMFFLAL
jgi:hypothetical protein